MSLYAVLDAHPWVATYLMRDMGIQPNSMRVYERFGQQLMRLDLTRRQRFHAVSALVSYIVGVGADMAHEPERACLGAATDDDRGAYLTDAVAQWRALDEAEFPLVHEVAPEFEQHDDEDQFAGGLDLLLAGISLQAGRPPLPDPSGQAPS